MALLDQHAGEHGLDTSRDLPDPSIGAAAPRNLVADPPSGDEFGQWGRFSTQARPDVTSVRVHDVVIVNGGAGLAEQIATNPRRPCWEVTTRWRLRS